MCGRYPLASTLRHRCYQIRRNISFSMYRATNHYAGPPRATAYCRGRDSRSWTGPGWLFERFHVDRNVRDANRQLAAVGRRERPIWDADRTTRRPTGRGGGATRRAPFPSSRSGWTRARGNVRGSSIRNKRRWGWAEHYRGCRRRWRSRKQQRRSGNCAVRGGRSSSTAGSTHFQRHRCVSVTAESHPGSTDRRGWI